MIPLVLFIVLMTAPAQAAEKSRGCFESKLCIGGVTLATIGGFVAADEEINRWVRNGRRGGLGDILGQGFGDDGSILDRLGGVTGAVGVPALFYLGGVAADSDRARRTGVTTFEAIVFTGLLTQAAHYTFGRSRPDNPDTSGVRRFKPFQREGFFPSGHTTLAFTMAAVIAEEYESIWVDAAAYTTASLVGFSRVYRNRHWSSDVAAGAALGIIGGKFISRWERKKGLLKKLYTDGSGVFFKNKF
ncbi:MAG: hypothetical protein COB53_02950 [Elusimicrobia bacterium]|nr:MAG: hypothetical protein COB53_02950 [Elusimicrobiota bacterium]